MDLTMQMELTFFNTALIKAWPVQSVVLRFDSSSCKYLGSLDRRQLQMSRAQSSCWQVGWKLWDLFTCDATFFQDMQKYNGLSEERSSFVSRMTGGMLIDRVA